MKKTFFAAALVFIAAFFVSCDDNETAEKVTEYYDVVFVTDGGTAVEKQTIASGQRIQKPEDPKKTTGEKKYFGGWYTDESFSEETKFDFSSPVTKTITLYARWLSLPEGSWLVKFITGCTASVADQIVKDGEHASEPEEKLTKKGFAFGWWYHKDEKQEYDFSSTPVTETTELTAKWNESGIYEAAYEDDTPFCMNIYDSLEPDTESGAW